MTPTHQPDGIFLQAYFALTFFTQTHDKIISQYQYQAVSGLG